MERQDGKDPFDPMTYNSPATIKSMVELRAFSAAFFEEHIRSDTKAVDQDLLEKFITLITSSKSFFARARAVIPELQPLLPPNELLPMNPNIQHVMQLTDDFRHAPDVELGRLLEDSAWSKLAKDGQEQHAKKTKGLATELTECSDQASDAKPPSHPTTPAQAGFPEAMESVEDLQEKSSADEGMEKPNGRTPHPLPNKLPPSEATMSIRPKLSNIPTFVPRNQAGGLSELVWSPTSGTRERRPEETYQSLTHPALDSRTFGQRPPTNTLMDVIQSHRSALSSIENETSKKGHGQTSSTDSIFVETEPYKNMPSPLGPNSPSFTRLKADTPSKHRVRNLANVSTEDLFAFEPALKVLVRTPEADQSMYGNAVGNQANREPPPALSENIAPNGPRYPINHARGIFGAEPFSAPPSKLEFGDLHASDQGMYGGPESPHFPPNLNLPRRLKSRQGPGIWDSSLQHQAAEYEHGSESSQLPLVRKMNRLQLSHATDMPFTRSQSRSVQSSPSIWNPSPVDPNAHSAAPNTTLRPSRKENEPLTIPPAGNMSALDYWNLLFHRQTSLIARLSAAKIPTTPVQDDYLTQLREARIATVVNNKMPARGKKAAASWLQVLEKELTGIWEQRPGDMPQSEVVMERKSDYEEGVKRAIQLVLMEMEQTNER